MKSLFKRDLSATRRATLEASATAATTLAQLRAERQAALIDADLAEIEKHDAGIAAQERKISTLQEKLQLLTAAQKQERYDEREQNRMEAIKRIEPQLSQREIIAAELEDTIQKMSALWFALAEFQSPVAKHWPFPMQPGFKFDLAGVNREMSLALFSAAGPIQGQLRMPQAAALDTGVTGRSAEGLANVVARQHAALLAALRNAPLDSGEPESEAA